MNARVCSENWGNGLLGGGVVPSAGAVGGGGAKVSRISVAGAGGALVAGAVGSVVGGTVDSGTLSGPRNGAFGVFGLSVWLFSLSVFIYDFLD